MRNIFIINPAAGKGKKAAAAEREIHTWFAENGGMYAVYKTERAGHATELAKEEAQKGGKARIFAVGGDGTLLEVLNGVYGYPNVELGCLPCGTGNDFLRCFPGRDFCDLDSQIKGGAFPMDVIQINGNKVALNICSVGYDANVTVNVDKFKKWPFVSGGAAYSLSLMYSFVKSTKNAYEIEIDGKSFKGNYLLVLAANGCCYGGGYQGAPHARPDDGMLDFLLAKSVPHLRILGLIGHYKNGRHEKAADVLHHYAGSQMTVKATAEVPVNVDGDIIYSEYIRFQVIEKGVNFVLPGLCAKKLEEQQTAPDDPGIAGAAMPAQSAGIKGGDLGG